MPGKGCGAGRGEAFKTFVAQVAEVSVDKEGRVKVDRVVCAVDCEHPSIPTSSRKWRVASVWSRRRIAWCDHLEGWPHRQDNFNVIGCCA